jgi:hypothetical protein
MIRHCETKSWQSVCCITKLYFDRKRLPHRYALRNDELKDYFSNSTDKIDRLQLKI